MISVRIIFILSIQFTWIMEFRVTTPLAFACHCDAARPSHNGVFVIQPDSVTKFDANASTPGAWMWWQRGQPRGARETQYQQIGEQCRSKIGIVAELMHAACVWTTEKNDVAAGNVASAIEHIFPLVIVVASMHLREHSHTRAENTQTHTHTENRYIRVTAGCIWMKHSARSWGYSRIV